MIYIDHLMSYCYLVLVCHKDMLIHFLILVWRVLDHRSTLSSRWKCWILSLQNSSKYIWQSVAFVDLPFCSCLSVCLSSPCCVFISLSFCWCLFLLICLHLGVFLLDPWHVFLLVCLSLGMSSSWYVFLLVCFPLGMSSSCYVFLLVCLHLGMSFPWFVFLLVCLSICLHFYWSVCVIFCWSVFLLACLFSWSFFFLVYLSIHISVIDWSKKWLRLSTCFCLSACHVCVCVICLFVSI